MASSSYYYGLYKDYKNKAKDYQKDGKELSGILNNLSGDLSDEIRSVNNELDALEEDLKAAIRHNHTFTSNAYNFGSAKKEMGVTADYYLSSAIDSLQDEVSRLQNAQKDAEDSSEHYYDEYRDAKEEENKAFWDKVLGRK